MNWKLIKIKFTFTDKKSGKERYGFNFYLTNDDEIFNALDDALIWTHSQWTIIKHHCSPNNASLEDAFGLTQEDIYRYIYLYKKYAI